MSISLQSGDLIRQKYRVERVLGQGGMGIVVAAWHMHLARRVAIKFLLPEMLVHPAVVERFLREGRAASAIEGDHVAKVIDVDTLDDGTPFLVMEYLEGQDLARVIESSPPLSATQAVGWVLQACEAVAEAHRLGIVHRDLKPANLFLATVRDGKQRVKVLDFGISKTADAGTSKLTRTAFGMGSAEYMSPEQCLSAKDVDARTDIWALGVILYQLLTRRVPYPGDNPTQIYAQAMAGAPARPRTLRPDIPLALEEVILNCLARDVHKRVQTVVELMVRLAPFSAPDAFIQHGNRAPAQSAPDAAAVEPAGRTVGLGAPASGGDTMVLPDFQRPSAPTVRDSTEMAHLRAGASPNGSTTGVVARDAAPPVRRSWPAFLVGALVLGGGGVALLAVARSREATAEHEPPAAAVPPTTATVAPLPSESRPNEAAPAPATSATPPPSASTPLRKPIALSELPDVAPKKVSVPRPTGTSVPTPRPPAAYDPRKDM